MDIFSNFGLWGAGWTGWIIPFLFGLSVVVFFHELGHFLVARWCGVRVLTFSVGFGPELVGFNDRYGTRWKLSAIPLGGYVKFFGDDNAASVPDEAAVADMTEEERRQSFFHQPVARRAAIVAAGPIANFILAIVIFAAIFALYGRQTTTARVDAVQPDSAAAAAGLKPGDVVLAIDGRPIESFSDMQRVVSANAGRTLTFQIDRGGTPMTLTATPALKQGKDGFGNNFCHAVLGVSRSMTPSDVKTEHVDPLSGGLARRQGNLVHHRPDVLLHRRPVCRPRMRRPTGRADPDRADFRSGRDAWLHAGAASGGHAFGVDRPLEPVPGPAARWRSPFVLRDRGDAGPPAVRASPGNRVSDRFRDRGDVDDIYSL